MSSVVEGVMHSGTLDAFLTETHGEPRWDARGHKQDPADAQAGCCAWLCKCKCTSVTPYSSIPPLCQSQTAASTVLGG